MNEAEFRLMGEMEADYWWYVGKRMILRALLPEGTVGTRLLDLGCGTGGVLRDWQQDRPDGRRCVGVDGSAWALRFCRERGLTALARADLSRLPFRPESFDTVVLMDVIEHLADDVALLRATRELCPPGGRIVVAVPAFPLLWSEHDVTFGHFRRYRAGRLRRVVEAAGLEVERTTYTNAAVFPAAALWRIASRALRLPRREGGHDFFRVPRWLNALLVWAYRLEAWLLSRIDLPFGVSVVCIARRPA